MWKYIYKVVKLFLKFSGIQELLDLLKDQTKSLKEMFPEVTLALARAFLFIFILIILTIIGIVIITWITLKMTGI